MSDIIYTPPASSGGGTTINPTNNFIPVRDNATTFVDSFILNDSLGQVLFTTFNLGGDVCGIYIDNPNKLFALGDFGLTNNGTYLSIDDTNQLITTFSSGFSSGLKIDYPNATAYLGDYDNLYNGTKFIVDYLNDYIVTKWSNNDIGLKLDFANNEYFFGDYNNITNGAVLICSVINQTIFTRTSVGNPLGIKTDFLNNQFALGDFDGINNSTFVNVSDTAKQIRLYTSGGEIGFDCDLLNFNGVLTSGSASGSSGQHLQVTINGTPYVIALLNP